MDLIRAHQAGDDRARLRVQAEQSELVSVEVGDAVELDVLVRDAQTGLIPFEVQRYGASGAQADDVVLQGAQVSGDLHGALEPRLIEGLEIFIAAQAASVGQHARHHSVHQILHDAPALLWTTL